MTKRDKDSGKQSDRDIPWVPLGIPMQSLLASLLSHFPSSLCPSLLHLPLHLQSLRKSWQLIFVRNYDIVLSSWNYWSLRICYLLSKQQKLDRSGQPISCFQKSQVDDKIMFVPWTLKVWQLRSFWTQPRKSMTKDLDMSGIERNFYNPLKIYFPFCESLYWPTLWLFFDSIIML